ncbi:MAG: ComF family protein [Clostridia bacterium]|nr:ComF family protein [Clostridia bacterium]
MKWGRLLELLYPPRARCVGCDDETGHEVPWFCEACMARLEEAREGAFAVNGFDGAFSAFAYAGPAGGAVRWLKYNGLRALAEPMAAEMARCASCEWTLPRDALVVPVPMHMRRLKRRGYNQSALLAKHLAKALGLECREAISRVRDTPQQAKLERDERRKNVKGAFQANSEVSGKTVLLVDDVFTTGATAKECARALKRAGAVKIYFASYAKG